MLVLSQKTHRGAPFPTGAIAILVLASACSGTLGAPSGDAPAGSGAAAGVGTGGSSGSSGNGKASAGTAGTALGGAGTSGAGASGGPSSGPRPVSLEGEPLYTRFVRLTNDQWENSVRDTLRLDGPTGASDGFLDAVAGTTDFDNNERVLLVNSTAWTDYQLASEKVADQVTATDAALQNVVATTDPATFIRTFGRRAFRRDLTDAEVTTYRGVYDTGAAAGEGTQSAFTKGARYVVSTMLQSPFFLYRMELGDVGAPLSGHEMATKLSLWLRDTTPSDAMLDAASSFATADGAASQAAQMLEDTAATDVMRKFHAALYKFALYDSITKTGVTGYSSAMNPEFKEASYLFFDRIFTQGLGVREILTSTVAFVGRNMAPLYGLTASGSGMTEVELADRPGYFSQAPFLALWGRNNDPDSIHRGARLNIDTLCADPGIPAIEFPSIPEPEAGETNRVVITGLTSGCAQVCHGQLINPIGFAFENFDGVGRFRETDNGQPVNTSGVYPFQEGNLAFSGAPELMQHMAAGTQAHQCWAKKLTSYALGRDLVETDRPLIESLGAASRASGASLKDVMLSLVKNDAFRTRAGGAQ
jgi:hypothetical protein